MAAPANTLVTGNMVGIREDLSNLISDITPIEVPFTSNAGKGPKPDNTFYEWQIDALAAVDLTNAQPEGNDATPEAIEQPVRVGNNCQISTLAVVVSGTSEVVKKAGRKSDLARAIIRRGLEMRRNIEGTVLQRNTGATSTDPRRTATMLSYTHTNVSMGAAGANPSAPAPMYSGNRTDGTQRTFDETLFKTELASGYQAGVKVDGMVLMVGPLHKQIVSGFTGIATRFREVKSGQASIIGAADLYVSDFGEITVVPNRFQRERDAWLLDFSYLRFRDLRPYHVEDLAKTGDSKKKQMLREWSLQNDNEAAHILYADLT